MTSPCEIDKSSFYIACFTNYDGCDVFDQLKIGTKLQFVAEENSHDDEAVAIYFEKTKLGYITKSQNFWISKILRTCYNIFEVKNQQVSPNVHPEEQIRVVVKVKSNLSKKK